MKQKLFCLLALVALLSACGPAPTPTMSVADLQGTAMAQAWIAVTQTQAAKPTDTPVPTLPALPTEMPVPTLMAFPTLALTQQVLPPVVATPTGGDPCNNPPPKKPKGTLVQVRFVNKSKSGLTLSFGMIKPNALGECGTYGFSLGKYDSPVVTVMAGCYWGYAYIAKPAIAKNQVPLCVGDTTKTVDIWITENVIGFH